jgi:hypothetical protein
VKRKLEAMGCLSKLAGKALFRTCPMLSPDPNAIVSLVPMHDDSFFFAAGIWRATISGLLLAVRRCVSHEPCASNDHGMKGLRSILIFSNYVFCLFQISFWFDKAVQSV